MSIILKAENISKQYRLGTIGTGTLSHDLTRWIASLRGKEDPFLKVGAVNDRNSKATEDYVWALRDINFEVKTGEVLGIIGKNGAGKSTLLKILSRVTSPTTGRIKTRGRIASLLEVGTGFHGELSGRENIFMNGAILGMTKNEIKSKLDEIIDFSGCEMYIDTPVKRYSSGMTVRLGFAVAAHLEPEILVIDEVLAVGDAEFQKKAIGKMQDLSTGQGRTVLFVSHNMASIQNLCSKVLVMENGMTEFEGNTAKAIDYYIKKNSSINSSIYNNLNSRKKADILEISMRDSNDEIRGFFRFKEPISINIKFSVLENQIENAAIGFRVKDHIDRVIFSSESLLNILISRPGVHILKVKIPSEFLMPGNFNITLGYHIPNKEKISSLINVVSFKIEDTGTIFHKYRGVDFGCVALNCKWEIMDK